MSIFRHINHNHHVVRKEGLKRRKILCLNERKTKTFEKEQAKKPELFFVCCF